MNFDGAEGVRGGMLAGMTESEFCGQNSPQNPAGPASDPAAGPDQIIPMAGFDCWHEWIKAHLDSAVAAAISGDRQNYESRLLEIATMSVTAVMASRRQALQASRFAPSPEAKKQEVDIPEEGDPA